MVSEETQPGPATVGSLELANVHLRLKLLHDETVYPGFSVEVRQDDSWAAAATGRFGDVIFRDHQDQRQALRLVASRYVASERNVTLSGSLIDEDGVTWTVVYRLSLGDDPRLVELSYRLTPSENRQVLRWDGPTILAGEGAFGARKSDALFPGLEYLLDGETSSSTAFAAETYAARHVPHPYKITIPMMAVSQGGIAVALFWDPNQEYGGAWRHPAAVFASPNYLEGQDNHLLGIFAPGVSRFLEENSREATRPFSASPDQPLTLRAHLTVMNQASAIDVVKLWVETHELPKLEPPHSWRDNVDLCVRSYLDVAWDTEAEGWHHTLRDLWGPRYEPRVIAQLWRYGQWSEGDPVLRARARDQVRRGLARALDGGAGKPNPAVKADPPHLELAIHHGELDRCLTGMRQQVQTLLDGQLADGSWPWRPELIQHASFDTEERRAVMGAAADDSSTGLTADRARHVLGWARLTGDAAAREAGLRAVAWCNGQRRPEGAQTWELHLHVPDVLAVPYLIDVNLDAHVLTGESSYLAHAERWAWTGLPFTWLWRAMYRPIMAYGTVPVFGVTFHDVQSWFGVDVHWNGLVYADALFRLAAATGATRWRTVAEGITICGMQQQPLDGPWLGMYPDAFSPVSGDEAYTWWLNPNLIGLNTFELAGLPLAVETRILHPEGVSPIHLTSAGTVAEAYADEERLWMLIDYLPGERSHTIIAGLDRPARVIVEGADLPEVSDLNLVDHGWQWSREHSVLLLKLQHGQRQIAAVEVR